MPQTSDISLFVVVFNVLRRFYNCYCYFKNRKKGQRNCINFGKMNRVIKTHKKVITNDLINSFYEYQVWKSNTNNKVFTKILSNLNSGTTNSIWIIRILKLQKQNFKYIFMAHLTLQLTTITFNFHKGLNVFQTFEARI